MRKNWPLAFPGLKIGLLGGSFDPAHNGHLHVAETSAAVLGLDFVWWLVSPQNPLKKSSGPIKKRLESAMKIAKSPKMVVTNIEDKLKTQYTLDTLRSLKKHYKGVKFVWLMGGDNLGGFEKWRGWKDIVNEIPICVVSRPTVGPKARLGRMARQFAQSRLSLSQAKTMCYHKVPVWIYVPARFNSLSSTALRAKSK